MKLAKKIIILSLASLFTFATSSEAMAASGSFEVYFGKTYYFSNQKMSWADANDFCSSLQVDGTPGWTLPSLPKTKDFIEKHRGEYFWESGKPTSFIIVGGLGSNFSNNNPPPPFKYRVGCQISTVKPFNKNSIITTLKAKLVLDDSKIEIRAANSTKNQQLHKPNVYVDDLEKYGHSEYIATADYTPINSESTSNDYEFNSAQSGQLLNSSGENETPNALPNTKSKTVFAGKCMEYGFQEATEGFANCIMQMEQAQAQANLEIERRAQLERSCGFARANGFLAPTRTGHFAESAQNANEAYSRCMAGLPPPHSYIINCNRNGSTFNCYAR